MRLLSASLICFFLVCITRGEEIVTEDQWQPTSSHEKNTSQNSESTELEVSPPIQVTQSDGTLPLLPGLESDTDSNQAEEPLTAEIAEGEITIVETGDHHIDPIAVPDITEQLTEPLPPVDSCDEAITVPERSYWDGLIDDHRLIYREVRPSTPEVMLRDKDGLGMTSLGFHSGIDSDTSPLFWDIRFDWIFLNGPSAPDVRSQVYDLSFTANYAAQFSDDVGIHLHFAPTFSGDWDNKTEDAFRMIGGGLITWQYQPGAKIVAGFTYLDRHDLNVLPVFGIRLFSTQSSGIELDLIYPSPKISWKTGEDDDGESWAYIGSEIGGGSWAIETDDNFKDVMGYRDRRLVIGWESRQFDGSRNTFEIGYVFNRRLDYRRRAFDRDLGDTVVFRWGASY